MRVLVAGATGALGTSLITQLTARGHSIVMLTPHQGSSTPDASSNFRSPSIARIPVDVTDRSAVLTALEGTTAHAVINLLGTRIGYATGFRHTARVNRLRTEGTSTLLAAAKRIGATRYVGSSVYYGYGFDDHGDTPLAEDADFGEPDSSRNDPVQNAIRSNEQQVRAFGGIALRFGHLYAPDASSVPPVPRRWSGSLPVVHTNDAATAAVLALGKGQRGAAYNIAAPAPATWRVLQEAQSRADGYASPIVPADGVVRALAPFASQVITQTSMRLETTAAGEDLGWSAQYPGGNNIFLPANTGPRVGSAA